MLLAGSGVFRISEGLGTSTESGGLDLEMGQPHSSWSVVLVGLPKCSQFFLPACPSPHELLRLVL